MIDLLKILSFKSEPNKMPLAFEFNVDKSAAPFLVTSSKSLLWVNEAPDNKIRAAVRVGSRVSSLFLDIVNEIFQVGSQADWGNVHPFSSEGVALAVSYVQSYGISEVECLIHPHTESSNELKNLSIPIRKVSWLPENLVVVVPVDRTYLGFVGILKGKKEEFVSVVHNPSRGIAFAGGFA